MQIAARCRTSPAAFLRLFVSHYTSPRTASASASHRLFFSSPSLSRFSNAHFYNSLSSHFPSSPEAEDSDFDSDSAESISNFLSTDLPIILRLLSQAKSKFSTQDEALGFLRSSPVTRPAKGLICSVLWELRRDWESAFLAFRWAGDCVLELPWAWHLMIWVLGKQRRFDLAWMVLLRMHRKSLVTRRALIIMMESRLELPCRWLPRPVGTGAQGGPFGFDAVTGTVWIGWIDGLGRVPPGLPVFWSSVDARSAWLLVPWSLLLWRGFGGVDAVAARLLPLVD